MVQKLEGYKLVSQNYNARFENNKCVPAAREPEGPMGELAESQMQHAAEGRREAQEQHMALEIKKEIFKQEQLKTRLLLLKLRKNKQK